MTETGSGEITMKLSSVRLIAASARFHSLGPAQSSCPGQRGNGHVNGSNGQFVTLPWEGLRWEAGPPEKSLAELELLDGIEKFLASRTNDE
jgi:hypothetical protein